MYRDKADTLSENEKRMCKSKIRNFLKVTTIEVNKVKILIPQLRSVHFILSVFRAWQELDNLYDGIKGHYFSNAIAKFEKMRIDTPEESPWVNFTAALSNAGYAKNRISTRHEILMDFLLTELVDIEPKERDSQRLFTNDQKIVIWERANHQCEWENNGKRCKEKFTHFSEADADHIVKWSKNGKTTVSNGRLLCKKHVTAQNL